MRNQTKNITIRLTPDEYKLLQQRVANSKMKQSDFLRKSILNNYIISTDGITKILPEILRIGNNINQIARACNIGNQPTFYEVQKQTEILNKIYLKIIDFLRCKSIETTIPKLTKKKMEETIIKLLEVYSEKESE